RGRRVECRENSARWPRNARRTLRWLHSGQRRKFHLVARLRNRDPGPGMFLGWAAQTARAPIRASSDAGSAQAHDRDTSMHIEWASAYPGARAEPKWSRRGIRRTNESWTGDESRRQFALVPVQTTSGLR